MTQAAPSTGRSRSDDAVETIRGWIIDGKLSPGSPLVESRLAAELGVSRVPVREALRRLGEQGLVDLRPGQSAQVVRRNARDIVELLEIREVLEGLAAANAAAKRSVDDVTALDAIIQQADALIDDADWPAIGRLNIEFHRTMTTIAGNDHLTSLVEGYRLQLGWLNTASAEARGRGAWDEHAQMLQAIVSQDAKRAEQLARRHTRRSRDAFVKALLDGTIKA